MRFYNDRGYAWYAKQDYDKAMADYNDAIRLDPKLGMAYWNLAQLFGASRRNTTKPLPIAKRRSGSTREFASSAFASNSRGFAWHPKKAGDKVIADFARPGAA